MLLQEEAELPEFNPKIKSKASKKRSIIHYDDIKSNIRDQPVMSYEDVNVLVKPNKSETIHYGIGK